MASLENTHIEGKHVQFFRVRIRRVFDEMFNNVSADEFKDIYGKHFKQNWSRAVALHSVWIKGVQDNVMKDLDSFIQEAKFNEKLGNRADIVSKCEADCNTSAWRPTGVPEEDFRAHIIQQKLKRHNELKEFLNKKELEVMQLKYEISAGRAKIQEIDHEVQNLMVNLTSAHDRHIDIQLKQMDHLNKLT